MFSFFSFRQKQALYDSGTAYLQAGDYESAVKTFAIILTNPQKNPDIHKARPDLIGLTANGDMRWIDSEYWYHPPAGWRDLSDLVFEDYCFSDTHVLGLKKDGTILTTNKDPKERIVAVESWKDLVYAQFTGYSFYGVQANGTILSSYGKYFARNNATLNLSNIYIAPPDDAG